MVYQYYWCLNTGLEKPKNKKNKMMLYEYEFGVLASIIKTEKLYMKIKNIKNLIENFLHEN